MKGKGLLLLADKPEEEDESEAPDMKKTAMKTFIAAVKSGDVDAACKAMDAYSGGGDYEDEE